METEDRGADTGVKPEDEKQPYVDQMPPYIDSGEYEGGTTVKVIVTHPYVRSKVLLVLNGKENKPSYIKAFNNQARPSAWGNPGGGMEIGEFEIFLKRFPDHPVVPLITDGALSPYNRNIVCCGVRECIDESGYVDVEVYPYTNLYRYDRDNRDDDVSIFDFMHRNGHRDKTLFCHANSLEAIEVLETDEIEKSAWFDLSVPLARQFYDRIKFPLHPYYSHVRRLMIAMRRAERMSMFDSAPSYCLEMVGITGQIHPSWGLVFPVGAGDPRFPEKGFRLNRDNWYKLFYEMVGRKMEMPSLDVVHEIFRVDIIEAKKREERIARGDMTPTEYLNEYTSSSGRGGDNIPVKVMIDQDREYAQWLEESLELPHSQRVAGPVA